MKSMFSLGGCLLWSALACLPFQKQADADHSNVIDSPPTIITASDSFAKGADVSWLTEMEASGHKFYTNAGQQQDLFQILKSKGINAIRLRVWVNPKGGWCSTDDVIKKALRAKAAGMRLMIDFHYSDYWADPGKQNKPAAWQKYTVAELVEAVTAHTTSVLQTLKSKGIAPEWVQVGNETNDGMLWEDGRASKSMKNFAMLINAGYDAVKAVDSSAKVIVHISNGYDNHLFKWMFSGLKANGAKWDIVGMSLYPSTTNWQQLDEQCLANINDMIATYHTPVMICEVGMDVNSPEATKSFLTDILAKVKSVPHRMGLGVFYWEPECYNWNQYSLGAFDAHNQPTPALDAFMN